MVTGKIVGIVFLLFGFLTLRYFPDKTKYQRGEMIKTGIVIGILSSLIGIVFLIFG